MRKNIFKIGLIILGVLFLNWFKIFIPGLPINSIPRAALKEHVKYVYTTKTTPSKKIASINDRFDLFFNNWLLDNQYGWTTEYTTFITEVSVGTGRLRLNVMLDAKFMVLAYPYGGIIGDNACIQITKKMTPEDFIKFQEELRLIGAID